MDKKSLEVQPEKSDSKQAKPVHKLVAGLVAVIVLLVLTLAIGGALVIFNQNKGSSKDIIPDYTENHEMKNNGVDETVQIDKLRRIEKFTTRNALGDLSIIVVLDYYSRLISIYVKEVNACYLIGGIFHEIGSFEKSLQMINNKTLQGNTDTKVQMVSQEEQVLNYDLLTADMKPYCSSSNGMYWLKTSTDSSNIQQTGRSKRAVYYCYRVIGTLYVCFRRRA